MLHSTILIIYILVIRATCQDTSQEYELSYGANYFQSTHFIKDATSQAHDGPIFLPLQTESNRNLPSVPPYFFRSFLVGSDYKVFVTAQPAKYLIQLGFIPTGTSCSSSVRNVFDVRVNGIMALSSFDPYASTNNTCYQSITREISTEITDNSLYKLLIVRLSALSGNATLSFIRVYKEREKETEAICDESILQEARTSGDHLAHSVPGTYRPITDSRNKGFATVFLDGRGSHTHFSYSKGSGRIVSYEWRDDGTDKVISTKPTFFWNFTRGVTRIKLTVIDSACSTDQAFTDITVTGNLQSGIYCYFYKPTQNKVLQPNTLLKWPRPVFSKVFYSTKFPLHQKNFIHNNGKFTVRCIFFVQQKQKQNQRELELFLNTRNTGDVRLYRDSELVLSTTSSLTNTTEYVSGTTTYEMIYTRTKTNVPAFLSFRIDRRVLKLELSHDQASVLPILTKVDPSSASVTGGANIRIDGYGLYAPLRVIFNANGPREIYFTKKLKGSSSTQVFIRLRRTNKLQGAAKLVVQSVVERRMSESLNFQFTSGQRCDDIEFTNTRLSTTSGNRVALNQPTSITMGPDNNLYIGTRGDKRVHRLAYDMDSMKLKSRCYSEVFVDERFKREDGTFSDRTVLGITFNPQEAAPKPYVSVSTLFWGRNKEIAEGNIEKWSNGNIERLKEGRSPSDQQICLVKDKTIVSGLPVADGDHSINELVFTQRGDLLITVGSFTNLGLPAGTVGGIWETYFSASILIAYTSKRNFNGKIVYTTPENPRTAVPSPSTYKDVDIYSTGLRNLFSMRMTRSGRIYGVDMGPNCKNGNASTTCDLYDEEKVKQNKKTFRVPTSTLISKKDTECQYGPGRPDKLLEIKQGKYYGHPNLQRASILNDRSQCIWIDPLTNREAFWRRLPAANYEPALSLVASAKTGLIEYGASHFCNRLRGDFIMTNAGNIGPWRVRMDSDAGKLLSKPFQFLTKGGLRAEENIRGDLLFPKYYGTGIVVARPKISTTATGEVKLVNALPFRHASRGGAKLFIGGFGFGLNLTSVEVKVGDNVCVATFLQNTEIHCTVPARTSDNVSVDVIVRVGESTSILEKAVLYMLA